jgi:uncharacterized membrane protein YkvA (DUF1232 family)
VFFSLSIDRRVPWLLKLSAASGLIYIFSPLDVMPDISGIGLLDDIVVSLLIMQAFIEASPREIVEEHLTRLNIDPKQVFVNVPRTVNDALELYRWAAERGYSRGQEAPRHHGPEGPGEPPPYSRYSAFNDDRG